METADDADHDQPDTVVFEVNVGQTGQSARSYPFASGVLGCFEFRSWGLGFRVSGLRKIQESVVTVKDGILQFGNP